MFLLRGFEFTHEAVREWEERFAPLLAEHIRRKRKGKVGRRWYVDETYIKVKGKWCYLYRAIDREGNLVDSMLSATRDMDCSPAFLPQRSVHGERTAEAGHHGWPRFVSTGDPGSARPESAASLQRVPEPSNRTGPPGRQTAILSDAGLWRVSVSPAILSSLRGSSAVLSTPPQRPSRCTSTA